MRVLNKIDRYHLVIEVLNLLNKNDDLKLYCQDTVMKHYEYIRETGKDLDEVLNWKWRD